MQTITVSGGVTKDLELRTSRNSNSYVMFSLAVNQGFGESSTTNYYQCCLFNHEAERIVKANVKKGSKLLIVGKLTIGTYKTKDGTDKPDLKITVSDWEFAGSKAKEGNTNNEQETPHYTGYEEVNVDNADLPF